jgi:integrase
MGLELQEALVIRVRDIDFPSNRVRVIPQRSKTARDIPIPLFTLDELQALVSQKRKADFSLPTTKAKNS